MRHVLRRDRDNAPLFVIFAAIISLGALSGANFPMTAALVADYYGETNNAINYGSIYAFKALGGLCRGAAVLIYMLYCTARRTSAGLRLLLRGCDRRPGRADRRLLVKRPTVEQMEALYASRPTHRSPSLAMA